MPAWQGSLGDEAVITAATEFLKRDRNAEVTLIGFDRGAPWNSIKLIDHRIGIPDFFTTGGWPERRRMTSQFCKFDQFFLLGTDMLDGHYTDWHSSGLLTIARQAAMSGIPTNAVGFSLKDCPAEQAIQGLRALAACRSTTMCIRDQVSLTRYKKFVAGNAELTADPAFLLEPDASKHGARSWVRSQSSEGNLCLGLNLSSHVYDSLSESEQTAILVAIRDSILALAEKSKPISVLLIPHDIRIDFDDVRLCKLVQHAIHDLPGVESYVMQTPYSPGIIKSIVAELDFVLSSRMHLAIACLGAGTPVGCITYQGKFEGLYQHFGISDCTISPEDAMSSPNLTEFLIQRVLTRASIASRIADSIPGVTRLAQRNFEFTG
ncbi:polysaccharide pyruvyl transferase family protein [Rosistilla oblonga]|uniref:polysaccharide pyruvyl transferase family protein n=1 Tax=Rosistilla oblonga TaxID=2527990 RepID=UPI0018D25B72|nr:polysaccharide pyruvyl transferase family protein [Rosistilla oblonga]